MAGFTSHVVQQLRRMLSEDAGLQLSMQRIAEKEGRAGSIPRSVSFVSTALPADAPDRKVSQTCPVVAVYCEGLRSQRRERFRVFSGEADMVVEIRVTDEQLESLQATTHLMVEAALDTLAANAGDWGDGSYQGGDYEVRYGPVKQGGKNYVQSTKISLPVSLTRN